MSEYNGGLTREQFLFYEIRILAGLLCDGYTGEEAIEKIQQENLFQFPTERMIKSIANACMRRIQALDNSTLVDELAHASFDVAKQINLYAIMRQNKIVWDFMTTVIGEKFRTQDYEFERKDLNLFFLTLFSPCLILKSILSNIKINKIFFYKKKNVSFCIELYRFLR